MLLYFIRDTRASLVMEINCQMDYLLALVIFVNENYYNNIHYKHYWINFVLSPYYEKIAKAKFHRVWGISALVSVLWNMKIC